MKPVLNYSNNWEADEYSIDGSPVVKLTKVEIDGKEFTVHSRKVTVRGSNVSTHYFINVPIVGSKMAEVDLNTLIRDTKIHAVEFLTKTLTSQLPAVDVHELLKEFLENRASPALSNLESCGLNLDKKGMKSLIELLKMVWSRLSNPLMSLRDDLWKSFFKRMRKL